MSYILAIMGNPALQAMEGRRGQRLSLEAQMRMGEDSGDGVPLAGWEKQDRQCLVIVDTSGVHQLHIGWCWCKAAAEPHIQLLCNCYFPASTKRPSTAFTFSLLDYFHIDSVECKTSALSFFSKLQRLTNSSSPHSVPVRPVKLLRLCLTNHSSGSV